MGWKNYEKGEGGDEGREKKCEVNAHGEGRGGERERIGREKTEEGKNEDNKKGFSVEGRTSYRRRGEGERKRNTRRKNGIRR